MCSPEQKSSQHDYRLAPVVVPSVRLPRTYATDVLIVLIRPIKIKAHLHEGVNIWHLRGFLYLVAIMDWHTRKVLAWRISNTLEAGFCVDALNEAIHKFGPPDIMNTDQGSQFTSFAWTDRLRRSAIRISMDGKGRFLDNIFVERLWRSLKYECVYLHAWETGSEAKAGIRKWMAFYNHKRPHSALGGRPPAVVYWQRNEIIQPDQQEQRAA